MSRFTSVDAEYTLRLDAMLLRDGAINSAKYDVSARERSARKPHARAYNTRVVRAVAYIIRSSIQSDVTRARSHT